MPCRRHDKVRDFRLILIPEGIGYRLNRRGKALDSQEIVDLDRASIDEFDLSRWGFVVTCRFTLNWEPIRVGCHESEHVGPSSIVGEACDFVSQLQIVMMLKRHDQKSGDALRNSQSELFCSMMAAEGSCACGWIGKA